MRKIKTAIISIVYIFSALWSLSGSEILKKVDATEKFSSLYMEMKQIITTSGGNKRTMTIRAWSINSGDKQLSEYLSPVDINGQKILMLDDGDTIWMYNPQTRRVRQLGRNMKKRKVMGSDFTYEDQSSGNFSKKFTTKLIGQEKKYGKDCYKLQLTPNANGPGYAKLIAWVIKDNFKLTCIDYYSIDDSSTPFKRLLLTDFRKIGNKTVAFKMVMENLEDDSKTVNITMKAIFKAKIPVIIFDPNELTN